MLGHDSDIHHIEFELPQGAVLSPILYNIYTYNQPQITEPGTEVLLFADKIIIIV